MKASVILCAEGTPYRITRKTLPHISLWDVPSAHGFPLPPPPTGRPSSLRWACMGCAVGIWGKVFVSMMHLRILGSYA